MNVLDLIAAHAHTTPEQAALLVDNVNASEFLTVTYRELIEAGSRLAARLTAHGVREGQRCGLQARQGREFIESALGILAAGLCVVPIPDEYEGEALERFAEVTKLHHLLRPGELTSYSGRGNVDESRFHALRPAYLRHTSGTTAQPKGVVIGHDAILARLAAANRGLGITPDDRILWLLPMAHHFVVSILLYLRYGATILLPSSNLARHVLSLAQRARASVIYASPFHYQLLAKDTSDATLDSVRLAVSTATGLRREIAEAFKGRFSIALVQALGIIEVGLPLMNLASAATKPTALGRALPDYDVWLRDEHGDEVTTHATADAPGEVCIRGPGMFDAYLEPWALATDLIGVDGFRTGDQGWFDTDGDLHLSGRRDNRISMAGMKFFCEEVEAVLDAHRDVRQSRVAPRPHAHLGEVPVASIVPADQTQPPTPDALREHCRRHLPPHKIPREFTIVAELPLTSTGKLRRA
jgi:long-chain acyl-CoA synthetase